MMICEGKPAREAAYHKAEARRTRRWSILTECRTSISLARHTAAASCAAGSLAVFGKTLHLLLVARAAAVAAAAAAAAAIPRRAKVHRLK